MGAENKFWLSIVALIALIVVTIILATTTFYRHQNEVIAELVAGGTDPLAASCAILDSYRNVQLCAILAVQ